MPMTISAIRAAQAEHSDDPFICLLTFVLMPAEPDIRIANDTVDVVSRGQTYVGCPFAILLPELTDQAAAGATIEVDNVDPRIWMGVRALAEAPEVRLEVVLASEPSSVLIAVEGLRLREATADRSVLRGRLVPDTVWQSGFPGAEFDPPHYAGMFGT